jgi:hypothetical protein
MWKSTQSTLLTLFDPCAGIFIQLRRLVPIKDAPVIEVRSIYGGVMIYALIRILLRTNRSTDALVEQIRKRESERDTRDTREDFRTVWG